MIKKGMSPIIATMLLVALTVVVIGIVWGVVNNLVKTKTEEASACFNALDKLKINNDYTCYDSDSNVLQLAIDVGELDLDSLFIHTSNKSNTKSFEITKNPVAVYDGVTMFDGSANLILPEKNSGETYEININIVGLTALSELRIAPKVKGYLCQTSEALTEFRYC